MSGVGVRPGRRALLPALLLAALPLVGACSAGPPAPAASVAPSPEPGPVSGSSTPAGSSSDPSPDPEPTTTNTLPPPPAPTAPAPSTAGDLDAASLPVPDGWRTVARKGGDEDGYRGNGTWVHARDPRYAAQDVITIGCAEVTRDDYPDPVHALEGTYTDADGNAGIGLVLEFADATAATRYWTRYTEQVRACTGDDPAQDRPVHAELLPAGGGLLDRRTYADDGAWTEAGRRSGSRVTLVILQQRLSTAAATRLLAAVG